MPMNTAQLAAALRTAKPALLSQDFVPVLTHFCFSEGTVYAYNDVAAIIVPCDTGMECALRGDVLLGVLDAMGEEIVFKNEEGGITISDGNSVVKLQYLRKEEFLFRPPNEEPNITLPFDVDLAEAFERALLTISTDAQRPELGGITVEMHAGMVTFYSSDNKSITQYKVAINEASRPRKSKTVVVPKTTAEQLLSLYTAHKDKENEIAFGDTILAASFDTRAADGVLLVSKLLGVKVATWADAIKKLAASGGFFEVPDALFNALTKADIVLGKAVERRCVMQAIGDRLLIYTEGGQFGDVHEEIDCKSERGKVTIDPAIVLRVLRYVSQMALTPHSVVFSNDDSYQNLVASYQAS